MAMKIVTWNCNGAFRKKFNFLAELNADIYVIQECENPALIEEHNFIDWNKKFLWTGTNTHKGLGIFADGKIEMNLLDWQSKKLEHFIACRINDDFNLVGTWCHGASLSKYPYIGQLWKYLRLHKSKLDKAVIAGDFNSNKFWDKKGRKWNHSAVVKELSDCGINSLYHKYFAESQGEEKQATFYLQKNTAKPYHLDYIFASEELYTTLNDVTIGEPRKWLTLSDHMPVVCELNCEV
jgi:exonuclease III